MDTSAHATPLNPSARNVLLTRVILRRKVVRTQHNHVRALYAVAHGALQAEPH